MEISYAPNNAGERERGEIYLNSEEKQVRTSKENAERFATFLKGTHWLCEVLCRASPRSSPP